MARLEEMQAFVKAVETQSLSEAARELNVSPSAISKQIRNLENRLESRLLHRTTRSLALSEPGQAFYERCKSIIADVERAEIGVHELQDEPQGTLRVTASGDFSRLHLADLLTEFAAQYPNLRLELTFTDRTVDILAEAYDVAIRIASLADSSLVARKLAPCRRVLTATPSYLEANGTPTAPDDLKKHECIGYEYMGTSPGWRFRTKGRTQTVHVKGRLRANAGWMIRDLTLKGLGIGFLPTFLVGDDLRAGKLVTLLDDCLDADTDIYVVYPSRAHLSTKVRVFVDFLVERDGSALWDASLQ